MQPMIDVDGDRLWSNTLPGQVLETPEERERVWPAGKPDDHAFGR